MRTIAGTTALVTGGASGIGLAIARALVREGARVAIADNQPDWLDAAAAELGDAAMAMPLDVTDRAGWSAAREAVEARFGPVDILVNNAGIGPDLNRLDEMAPDHFDRLIAIKVTGTYNGIHCIVPGMRTRGRGHVVNTASMAGLMASARLGAYTAAKFAVVGLSEVLRAELEPDGIGVSVLCPGLTATRLAETSARNSVQRARNPDRGPQGIDPAVVGDLVVEGIRENHMHIVTHAEYRPLVEARMTRVLEAFDRVPVRTADGIAPSPKHDDQRNG
jgi:NAD(P)-dependent dehydrogenase (short-subunit alcohol dehydrogenase family)